MEIPKTKSTYFCPVTGLPVEVNPQWRGQRLGNDYTVNYYLVGQSILYSSPTGSINLQEMKRGVEFTKRVVDQITGGTHPLVMVYDLKGLNSATLEARRYFLRNYLETDYICTLIFCNPTPLLRIGVKIGLRFNTSKRPAFMADNYAKAIIMAQKSCDKNQLKLGSHLFDGKVVFDPDCQSLHPIDLRSSKAWHIRSGQYANESVVIRNSVLFSTSRGYLKPPDIVHIDAMRESVHSTLPPGSKIDYIIVDSRELKGGDRQARKQYMQSLVNWHNKHPIKMYILIGANTFIRAATFLAKPILKFRIEIAQDLNHAYALVRKHRQQPVSDTSAPVPNRQTLEVTHQDVDRLLAYIASVNWEQKGIDTNIYIDTDHPFFPVVQAIGLIKNELDDLFAERKVAEVALKKTEEKYRELFEKGSDWLCIHDLDGNLLETNFEFKAKIGWVQNATDLLNIKDLTAKQYRNEVDAYLKRIQEKQHLDLRKQRNFYKV